MAHTLTRLPSDGCAVRVRGRIYHPHIGEWIESAPTFTSAGVGALRRMAELPPSPDVDLVASVTSELCDVLRGCVAAWNWTDDSGEPYPQPADDPDVFGHLRIGELVYLVSAVNGLEKRNN